MKILYILLFISISCLELNDETFDKILTDLKNLENYIKEYIQEKSYTETTLTHLITCYIRLGAYTTEQWNLVGGKLPDDLTSYITEKDEEKGTSAQSTQSYRDFILPNGEKMDFVHMFAVMNGIENGGSYSKNYAHLVGWGGDTEQLLEDIMNVEGDLDYIMQYAKENYFRITGGFDEGDYVSDLDGAVLLFNKNDNNYFADLIKNYYTSVEYKGRVKKFFELTFPSLVDKVDKETFRNELYNIYNSDTFIKVLECQKGMRDPGIMDCYTPSAIKEQYLENQKAAVYVVSDYFFENYGPSPDPEEESDNPNPGNIGYYQSMNFVSYVSMVHLLLL